MIAAALSGTKPGEKVLDLCAAPGGKTTALAAMLGGRGVLLANEIHPERAKILSQNVERMGIRNAVVTNETPEHLAERFGFFFDRVIVDAPCSGEGMFAKEPEALAHWYPENVAICAARQRDILESADRMLREGGVLVYSTCTFAPEEDEGTIGAFLAKHPEYHVIHDFAFPLPEGIGVADACPHDQVFVKPGTVHKVCYLILSLLVSMTFPVGASISISYFQLLVLNLISQIHSRPSRL